jgi:hypothetical protein
MSSFNRRRCAVSAADILPNSVMLQTFLSVLKVVNILIRSFVKIKSKQKRKATKAFLSSDLIISNINDYMS